MIANWKLWAGAAAMAAGLSIGAAAPASAQEASWYCYGTAEIVGGKGLVITQVFEWRGTGRPPQNAMGHQLQPLTKAEMPEAPWPMVACWQGRAQAEDSRSARIRGYQRMNAPVRTIYFSFSG